MVRKQKNKIYIFLWKWEQIHREESPIKFAPKVIDRYYRFAFILLF